MVLRLLQSKVNTFEFSGDTGVGNIRFDKSFVVFEVIIVPVVLLLFAVEKFKGLCLVFLLLVSAPVSAILMTLSCMGRGVVKQNFFNNTRVDVEYLVCALAIAGETKEYAKKHTKVHDVDYKWLSWAST